VDHIGWLGFGRTGPSRCRWPIRGRDGGLGGASIWLRYLKNVLTKERTAVINPRKKGR